LRAFAAVSSVPLPIDCTVSVRLADGAESGLAIEAFAVRGDPPRFAPPDRLGATVGLAISDRDGTTVAYVPGCGEIDRAVASRLRGADAVLFDGTFWRDDELPALGISPTRAREMGHVPIVGPGGSLALLADLPAAIRVYTHINNTNPILIEDSAERRALEAAGVVAGVDGLTFEL